MATPVSKAELARRRGVTRQAVNKAVKPGGRLHAAVLDDGRVDIAHPDTQTWLGDSDGGPADRGTESEIPEGETTPVGVSGAVSPDMPEIRRMPLEDIVERYGTILGFSDHVAVLKKIEETHKLELANAERRGEVIEREFVQVHVFGVMRALTRRILRDAPKTLSKELYAMAQAGRPIEDAEKAIRDELGKQIKTAKVKVSSALGGRGPKPTADDGVDDD